MNKTPKISAKRYVAECLMTDMTDVEHYQPTRESRLFTDGREVYNVFRVGRDKERPNFRDVTPAWASVRWPHLRLYVRTNEVD